jgi:antitoxin MazE
MKTNIIRIGNSRGIRIPKAILEQTDMPEEVDIHVEGNQIVIKPARTVREGWRSAFQAMADVHDDRLLDEEFLNQPDGWDLSEWEW